MLKVLVTGGFGGLGQHITSYLLEKNNSVTVFDIKNPINEATAREITKKNKNIVVNWGDITKPETFPELAQFDGIIHMAFIIPPAIDKLPVKVTEKVNINGTKSLIDAAKKQGFKGKFIFASSVSLFGPTKFRTRDNQLVKPNDPIAPSDIYTYQKAICEEHLKQSGLRWLILRISAAPYLKVDLNPKNLRLMRSIPYDQKFEFVHPKDAAVAFGNAVTADVENEILIIAGGKKCQLIYNEMLERFLSVFNLPSPDPRRFTTNFYYLDFYDTSRSQEKLQFQSRTLDDFVRDFTDNLGSQGEFIKAMAPIAKFFI